MSIEDRLRDALRPDPADPPPSPDLFARVQRSMADDRRRRGTRMRWLLGGVGMVAAVGVLLGAVADGGLAWWWVEVLVTLGAVGLVVGLGPLIRRFGQGYADGVFAITPEAGRAFLRLVDIAYYLIFVGYLAGTVRLAPKPEWAGLVTAELLREDAVRVGGLLALMGVLHSVNLILLPVLGRLLGLNRRLGLRDSNDGNDGEVA